jgi:hypothetical protein
LIQFPFRIRRSFYGESHEISDGDTGEQGRHHEISDGDSGGGRDSDGVDGGVLASLGEVLPSSEGERSRLMPFLFSIGG